MIRTVLVFKGELPHIQDTLSQGLYLTLPKGTYQRFKASLVTRYPLMAPLAANTQVGELRLHLEGALLGEYPSYAERSVPLASVFGRLRDSLRLLWL